MHTHSCTHTHTTNTHTPTQMHIHAHPHKTITHKATQLVLDSCPSVTVDYCLTFFKSHLEQWKGLMVALLRRIEEDTSPELESTYRSVYKGTHSYMHSWLYGMTCLHTSLRFQTQDATLVSSHLSCNPPPQHTHTHSHTHTVTVHLLPLSPLPEVPFLPSSEALPLPSQQGSFQL